MLSDEEELPLLELLELVIPSELDELLLVLLLELLLKITGSSLNTVRTPCLYAVIKLTPNSDPIVLLTEMESGVKTVSSTWFGSLFIKMTQPSGTSVSLMVTTQCCKPSRKTHNTTKSALMRPTDTATISRNHFVSVTDRPI